MPDNGEPSLFGGGAGLLLLVWCPRNDGARSEILTTAPSERGK
jgi:hypothetical protein